MRIRYFCLGFVLPFAGINFKFLYGHNFLVSDLTEVCVASSVHMDKMDEVRVIDTRKICHHYQVQLVLPICIFCTCRCHMCFFFYLEIIYVRTKGIVLFFWLTVWLFPITFSFTGQIVYFQSIHCIVLFKCLSGNIFYFIYLYKVSSYHRIIYTYTLQSSAIPRSLQDLIINLPTEKSH